MNDLPRIGIVGSGRAAQALGAALTQHGYPVVAVHSRNLQTGEALARLMSAQHFATALAVVRASGVTLLAVPDGAITGIAATIAAGSPGLRGRTVLHLSASHDREVLASLRQCAATVGALHPLAALCGAGSAASLQGALALLEADPGAARCVRQLAVDLGLTPVSIDSSQRRRYHAAAVLAAAGAVALQVEAAALLESTGIDSPAAMAGITALMRGALDNAAVGGSRALTGPVVRDDGATVRGHLEALAGMPQQRELYLALLRATVLLHGAAASPQVAAVAAEAAPISVSTPRLVGSAA